MLQRLNSWDWVIEEGIEELPLPATHTVPGLGSGTREQQWRFGNGWVKCAGGGGHLGRGIQRQLDTECPQQWTRLGHRVLNRPPLRPGTEQAAACLPPWPSVYTK